VILLLNNYLGEMSDAILAHGGTLIAYMGDGIMAAFGAPIEQTDHADRAIAASREMIVDRLPGMNDWMRERGHEKGFRMGIGLHSGEFISGNVGTEQRLEYTAIGDTCNTAARLEGMTKGTGHTVFLSSATRAMMKHAAPDLTFVGDLAVRGRSQRLAVWTLDERAADGDRAERMAAQGAAT
jgi:adenylate cyclase